jgi:hypothetical protein
MPEVKIVVIKVHGIQTNFAGGGKDRRLTLDCADYHIRHAVSSAIGSAVQPYITHNEVCVEFVSPGRQEDGSTIYASVHGLPPECIMKTELMQRVVDYVQDQLKSHIGRSEPRMSRITVNAVDDNGQVIAVSRWEAVRVS